MTTPVLAGGGFRMKAAKSSDEYVAAYQRKVAANGGNAPVLSAEAKRKKLALVLDQPDGIQRLGLVAVGPLQVKLSYP